MCFSDNLKEKLSLIEDIFIAEKALQNIGLNKDQNLEKDSGKIFDSLMDCSNDDLLLLLSIRYADLSLYYKSLAGFKENETTIKPIT